MILSLYRHIVFANYSLGDHEVSRTAAVYAEDSLLFVVGNKVCLAGFPADPLRYWKKERRVLNLNTSRSKIRLHLLKVDVSLCLGFQMFKVPSLGPGCAHFRTCSTCLMAPRFMNCGWCSGVCSRQHECTSQWNTDSCAPIITEVRVQHGPQAKSVGRSGICLTPPTSLFSVFPQSCAGGRGDGGDPVRVGVPVSAEACHHQRQNSQSYGGIHRLCRPAREK